MHSQTVHVEGLESRTFLSATSVFNTTVLADRLQVRMDLLQFRLDGLTCSTTLLKDVTTARADGLAKATTAKPSIKQFHADVQAMRHTLQADRLNEATNVLKDEITILGDRRQLLKDAGNATAQAADHAKLLADRIHLQNDMIAGLDARLATRQAAYDKIFADIQSIGDAVTADPNASDALKADVQKWMTDRTNCLNTMTADIQKLVADRTQLANDLTASQSQG